MKGSFYLIIIISLAAISYFWYVKKKLNLTLGKDCDKSTEYKNFTFYQNIAVGALVVSSLAVVMINDNPNVSVNPGVGEVIYDNKSTDVNKPSRDDLDITSEEFVQAYNWALDRLAENDVRKYDGWKISSFTQRNPTELSAKFENDSSGGISGTLNNTDDSKFAFMSLSTYKAPPAVSVAFAYASIYKKISDKEIDEVINRIFNNFKNNGNKSGLQEDQFTDNAISFKLQIYNSTNVSFKIAPINSSLSFATKSNSSSSADTSNKVNVPLGVSLPEYVEKYNAAIEFIGRQKNKDYSSLKAAHQSVVEPKNEGKRGSFNSGNHEIFALESDDGKSLYYICVTVMELDDFSMDVLSAAFGAANCGSEYWNALGTLIKNGGGTLVVGNVLLHFNMSQRKIWIIDADFYTNDKRKYWLP